MSSDWVLTRDDRIDLARWCWDIVWHGLAPKFEDAHGLMKLGEDIMQKLADDLGRQAKEMRSGKVDPATL